MEPKTLVALRTQILLEWEELLHGFLTIELVEAQQMYYTELGSRKTGYR